MDGFTDQIYPLEATVTNTGGGILAWQMVDHFGQMLKTRGHTVGTSDYAVIPNQPQVQLFGGNFTVSAWVKVESNLGQGGNGGKQYIFSKSTESTNGFIGLYTDGIAAGTTLKNLGVQLRNSSSTNFSIVKTNILELNRWYHVSVSYGQGQVKLYLNGNVIANQAVPSFNGNTTAWALGKLSPTTSTTYRFCGSIDEFRIWDSALDPAVIRQRMYTRLAGNEAGLAGYWNLDNGSLNDGTVYNNHGTLYGGASIINSDVSGTPAWLGLPETYGSVSSGTNEVVSLNVNTQDLIGGVYNSNLQVRSNDPLNNLVQVPITLRLTGYAVVSLSRDNISFGDVFTGSTGTEQLQIYNNGSDVLNISNWAIDNPLFSTNAAPLQIAAGASTLVSLFFNPTNQQAYTGNLTITTNAVGFETITIPLSGSGADYPLISLSANSFSSTLDFGAEETQLLEISNLQGVPLEYNITLTEDRGRDILNGDFTGFPPNIRGMAWVGNLLYLVDYAASKLLVYNPANSQILHQYDIHRNPWVFAMMAIICGLAILPALLENIPCRVYCNAASLMLWLPIPLLPGMETNS